MPEDIALLDKVFKVQLEPLINCYMVWITPELHEEAIPAVKTFSYSVEPGSRHWEKSYIFTLSYHGRNIRFVFASNGHGECLSVNIDFDDVVRIRERLAIVSELTYAIYAQLNNYAVTENIPPQNVII